MEFTHAWARASKPSADSAPGLGEWDRSSSPAECARSSTSCASLILSRSCGIRATGRVGECKRAAGYTAGREVAHHLGEEEEGHYLVHVLLEKHAGDLSDARCWIQRLLYTGAVWASLCRAAVVGKVACNIRQERCDGPG